MLVPRVAAAAAPLAFLLALSNLAPAAALADDWQPETPLPVNRGNNAVAAHTRGDTCHVYSFMGIDETRIWSGIQSDAWRLNTTTGVWQRLPDVPGPVGRIAAAAAAVGDRVYLFGGYSVAATGAETTWPNVDIFDPATMQWSSGTPIPVRVDDQVIGVWNDRLIYLISGWSQTHNVGNVQIYDPAADSWQQGTPIIGPPVFGAAGAIVGNDIIYADGVSNAFSLIHAAYRGTIDPQDPTSITWAQLAPHPGDRGYRMAAGVVTGPGRRVYFAGGTNNAYNFNGIGFNGIPSEPTDFVFAFDAALNDWVTLSPKPTATMDHRGMVDCGGRLYVVGGFEAQQTVSGVTESYRPDATVSVPADGRAPAAAGDRLRLAARPVPARDMVTVRFRSERAVDTRVTIHDAVGRLVRVIHGGMLPAGAHALGWNLRGADGERVARGVYLVRVRHGAASASAKLVVGQR